MKLLTPKIAVESSKRDEQDAITRITYLNETLSSLQKRINTEQENFDKRIKEQRDVYGEEKRVLQDEVRVLSDEVSSLLRQRKQAMIPIRELENEAKRLRDVAQGVFIDAQNTRVEAEEMHMLYQKKMDTLTSREQDFDTRSLALSLREDGSRREAAMISESHTRHNEIVSAFNMDVARQIHDLSQRESEHKLKELALQDSMKEFEKRKGEAERVLADKRAALERAFTHIKNQK